MNKSVRSVLARLTTVLVTFFLNSQLVLAAQGVVYHGRIVKSDGTPLEASSVAMKLQIRSPGVENCLLYEESKTVDMTGSNGAFVFSLNDGTATRTDLTGYLLPQIFSNRVGFSFTHGECTATSSYIPSATDVRKLMFVFKESTATVWETVASEEVKLAPLAMESLRVGGYDAGALLRVEDAGVTGSVSPLTTANYTELVNLVNGSSTKYVLTGTNGASLPVVASAPAGAAAGSVWYNSSTNSLQFFNGTVQTLSTGGGSVTSMTSGTISGTTVINTSGSIVGSSVSGTNLMGRNLQIMDSGTFAVKIQTPTSLAAGYTLTLPTGLGSTGQVLTTDNLGQLSWTTPTVATSTSVTAGAGLNVGAGPGGTITTAGTLNIDVGLTAGKILQVATGNKYPVLDGSNITALSASNISSGALSQSLFPAMTGDVTSAAGTFVTVVGKIQGTAVQAVAGVGDDQKFLRYDNTLGKYLPSYVKLSELKNAAGASAFNVGACGANQTVTWSSLTDTMACQNIGSLSLATAVTGTLGAGNGGTGLSSYTVGDILYASTTSALSKLPASTSGYVLTSNGAGTAPSWQAAVGDSTKLPLAGGTLTGALVVSSGNVVVSAGSVGIGTAAPGGNIDVRDSTGAQLLLANSTAGNYSFLNGNGGAHLSGNAYWDQTNWNRFNIANPSSLVGAAGGIVTFYTAPAGANPMGAAFTEKMRVDNTGNVGIGTATPAAKLDVAGTIRSLDVSNTTTTIDFSTGNYQYTSAACGAMTLNNLKSGATYMLAVQGAAGGTCAFTAWTGAGTGALTVKAGSMNLAQTANKHAIFTFAVLGSFVYVSAVDGF